MSVVDGKLKVHEIDNLGVADDSITPRVTTGNTMAPGVIGKRAAEILQREHELQTSSSYEGLPKTPVNSERKLV